MQLEQVTPYLSAVSTACHLCHLPPVMLMTNIPACHRSLTSQRVCLASCAKHLMAGSACGTRLARRCCVRVTSLSNVTKIKNPATQARIHHAACFHLYMHYTCIMTGMRCKGIHICIPDCVEKYIMAYLRYMNYISFQEHPKNKKWYRLSKKEQFLSQLISDLMCIHWVEQ